MKFLTLSLLSGFILISCVASQLREQRLDCRSQSESACAVDDPEYDYLNKIPVLPPAASNFDKPPVFPSNPPPGNSEDQDQDPVIDDEEEIAPEPEQPLVPPLQWKCAESSYQGRQIWTCDQQRLDVYRCNSAGQVEFQKCDHRGCRVSSLGCDDACASAPVKNCP